MKLRESKIDWTRLSLPLVRGDRTTAYRDPAAVYHQGRFLVYHSLVIREEDGLVFWYLGLTESEDLLHWSNPRPLTPRDQNLNFSSPGNIIRFGDKWILCLQTYPTPNNEVAAIDTARIWKMESKDLRTWGPPEMMMVKGPEVAAEEMGRMIDPYLVRDKDEPNKWWCFYKQNGVSMSYTHDFKEWTFFGSDFAGENVSVLVEGDFYILFHSVYNGFAMKRSPDLVHWEDFGDFVPCILGQRDWPWAQGRLTAAQILDLRTEPAIGRYLAFFHGETKEGREFWHNHGNASLGLAWSSDLLHWQWPKT